MKFSINLAQQYSNVDIKSIAKDELLRRIGAQLGAVEDVIDWSQKFDGVVVAKIIKCDKHPDADRLNVCLIDDGGQNNDVSRDEDGLIQVVCGAPNARAGIYVAWLAPGVAVPSSLDTDPFVLEARGIRGVISNGMLASMSELGIGDDHSGILEIDIAGAGREPVVGEPFVNYFGLDDFIVDCENKMFTHRPDCFGNLGIAREVAGITGQGYTSPKWYLEPVKSEIGANLPLSIKNDVPELVPRFMAVALDNIIVGPSPLWLQTSLFRVGIKPINNVVDVTNYVMHLTGQPLHAFDYDKVSQLSDNLEIFPRLSSKGEKIKLLGQKEIELSGEEVVISTDRQAIALGGVMGGVDTEVDDSTTRIIIECATFDMYNVRRTSMRHGLFTEAVTRLNKGQSPLQNPAVIAYAVKNMIELAGANQASQVLDNINFDISQITERHVEVEIDFINQRLGTSLEADDISTLLENVEFRIEVGMLETSVLKIFVPFWRMDIQHPEDIVEEVGRLYGYDRLDINLPLRPAKPSSKNRLFDYKYELRDKLSRAGANEVLTYSFVHRDLLKKSNIDADSTSYHIRNAISPDLQYYRPTITPSLLSKIHSNIKAEAGSSDNKFAIFEIGKTHRKGLVDTDGLPVCTDVLALVVSADDKSAENHRLGTAYYLAKKYLDMIAKGRVGYNRLDSITDHPLRALFAPGRSAIIHIDDTEIGVIGEFNQQTIKKLKLPQFSAGFELDIEKMQKLVGTNSYKSLAEFPPIKQDITLELPLSETYESVLQGLRQKLLQASVEHGYKHDITPVSIYHQEGSVHKNITFRIIMWHPDQTLTNGSVNKILGDLL